MRKAITIFIVVSILCAVIPFSASATRIDEITQQIRNAQADAIRQGYGVTINNPEVVQSATKDILQKQIAQQQSADDSKCSEDHNAIAKESRNKGRIEASTVCVILFAVYVLLQKGILGVGVLRHILAIPLGLITGSLARLLLYVVIGVCSEIPLTRWIFYLSSDSSWALTVFPSIAFASVAAWVGLKIANNSRPVSVAVFIYWFITLLLMLCNGDYTWHEFGSAVIGAGSGILFFAKPNLVTNE